MRKVFLTGTGISIIVSVLLTIGLEFVSTSDFAVSVLVALVSLLIGLIITALFAFADRLDRIDRARFDAQPLQELHRVPELERPLIEIVNAVASSVGSRSPFLKHQTQDAVREFSVEVRSMANGSFLCSSKDEEVRLVKSALAETKTSVKAVASRGPDWWARPEADVYFRAYHSAAKRVQITRIFMVKREDLEVLTPILDRHVAAGIKTFALDPDQVPESRRRGLVLFDDKLLHRSAAVREGSDKYKNVEFTDIVDHVDQAKDDFEFLYEISLQSDSPIVLYSKPVTSAPRRKSIANYILRR